jgi:hypothetical protein
MRGGNMKNNSLKRYWQDKIFFNRCRGYVHRERGQFPSKSHSEMSPSIFFTTDFHGFSL